MESGKSNSTRAPLRVASLLLLASLACAGRMPADDWMGWRGVANEGRSSETDKTQLPTSVRWTAAIVGDGHSSPIVTEDTVYVTAALPQTMNAAILRLLSWIQWGGAFLVAVAASRFLDARLSSYESRFAGLLEDHWFDCVCGRRLLDLRASPAPCIRRLDDVQRDRKFAVSGTFWWLIFSIVIGVFLSAIVFLASVLLNHSVRLDYVGSYRPRINWQLTCLSAVLFPAFLMPQLLAKFKTPMRALGVISGAFVAIVGVLGLFEQIIHRVPYLSYLFHSESEIEPVLGWMPVFVLASAVVVAILKNSMLTQPNSTSLSSMFRVAAIILAAAYWYSHTCLFEKRELVRSVVAVDRATGKVKWQATSLAGPAKHMHRDNSPATPTPVTDGERVLAYFGTSGLMCVDERGQLSWSRTDLPFFNSIDGGGAVSSPFLVDDKVLLVGGTNEGTYMACIDVDSGEMVWMKDLSHREDNHRTPVVSTIQGRTTILFWDTDALIGLCPNDGSELWRHEELVRFQGEDQIASIVSDDRHLYLAGPHGCCALSLEAIGTDSDPVVWQNKRAITNCASPVLIGNQLVVVSPHGIVSSVNALDGKLNWKKRLHGRRFYASPVAIGQYVYVANTDGLITVLHCGDEGNKAAELDCNSPVYASPAIVNGQLIVRTTQGLCMLTHHEGNENGFEKEPIRWQAKTMRTANRDEPTSADCR